MSENPEKELERRKRAIATLYRVKKEDIDPKCTSKECKVTRRQLDNLASYERIWHSKLKLNTNGESHGGLIELTDRKQLSHHENNNKLSREEKLKILEETV